MSMKLLCGLGVTVALSCSRNATESRDHATSGGSDQTTTTRVVKEDMIPIAPGTFTSVRPVCADGSLKPEYDPILQPEKVDGQGVISAYSIDRRVATCADFTACVVAGGCTRDESRC